MKPKQIVVLCVFLLLSGFCSLVYQNVWLREFRLIFGGTNAASATVFAIFMGGLGSGGLFFGRRSETSPNPLRLYGWLELGAAGLALASLPLLKISELLYLKSGGVFSLGFTGGTVLRLALATLSIGACAFFMGGNVPVAVKFFQADRDRSRRGLAILYGVNVIGAVLGTLVATFWCLENFGSKGTLIVAAIINVAIGLLAINFSKTQEAPVSSQKSFEPTGQTVSSSIQAVVLCYSFLAGFLFFVMELVWIRMLLPLMGGSVYVPGSMLAVVLAGIGVGGFAYATRRSSRVPTVGELAVTLGFFAIALVLPLALGDRVAFLAFHLNQLRAFGFTGQVSAWLLVASLLVLLPSLIAGYQFPLFTGLLGRGNRGVGQHLGLIYLSNTLGSITGSLAGGLLLLPGLGAVGLWRAATIGALILCVIALAISLRRKSDRRWLAAAVSCAAVVTTTACLTATGPTAVWRHTPIGYGDRVKSIPSNPGELKNWMHSIRFGLLQDFDGREANIGIYNDFGLGFFTNGKGDGSVRGDAAINIMTGVLGALLHPEPKSACVIGLGT
jgi:spermidine synthase